MASNYWDRFTQDRMGRRRLLKTGAAFSIGAASLALIGCGSDDDDGGNGGSNGAGASPTSTTPSASGQPKRGGNFGTYFATVGNYNTVAFYHDGYNNSGVTVYDRLLTATLDARGYVLQAAASVELQDPTTVVFKLKPGMKTHNQEPVNGRVITSADIKATQEYVAQLPNAENSGFQRQRLDRVEAPDDETVVFKLKAPFAYVFASTQLANPTAQLIIPQEMLPVLDTHPAVGSGPYELVSHTFGSEYNYRRFEEWHGAEPGGKPYFDEQLILSLTDVIAQETAFRGDRIHEWEPPGAQIDRLLDELDPNKYANMAYLGTGLDGFNAMMNAQLGGPRPWHDIRFREAIYRLTNREQLIGLVADGKAVVPPGPLMASLEAYQLDPAETEEFFRNDVDEAKKLLEAMEYDTNQEWVALVSNTSPVNAQMGEVWQQQLARAGIKIRVQPAPLAEILPQRMQPGNFDFFVGGQPGGDTPYRALRNQHSDTLDQFNNVGLYDPELDAMIERSEQETDREAQIELVKEIQREALRQYTMSYNAWNDQIYKFYNARVQNFDPDPLVGQSYRTEMWFA